MRPFNCADIKWAASAATVNRDNEPSFDYYCYRNSSNLCTGTYSRSLTWWSVDYFAGCWATTTPCYHSTYVIATSSPPPPPSPHPTTAPVTTTIRISTRIRLTRGHYVCSLNQTQKSFTRGHYVRLLIDLNSSSFHHHLQYTTCLLYTSRCV